jgi:nucleoside-diphosphate-sugar epimerase
MRLLILGGTAWLSREVARTAQNRGDAVTCLARGTSGPAPDGPELVTADRTRPDAYDAVRDRDWDAVIDVSRQPGQVRSAAAALRNRAAHYVFVSSISVYADIPEPGRDESSPLLPPLAGDVMESMADYGPAKVTCEQHVRQVFGAERSLVARVGLIGGPGDRSTRTSYWPWRFHRAAPDGPVLVPDAPDLPTSVIDARDLAAWLVEAARQRTAGVLNATGPVHPLAEHLETARMVAGHTGPVVPVEPSWLTEQKVQAWMGERSLPLWLDDPSSFGLSALDSGAAYAAGLVTRPLAETLADTLAWELTRPADQERPAGLSDADERALLDAWRTRSGVTSSSPGS